MIIKIKKLKSTAIVPEYKTEHAAASDLCACIDEPYILKSGQFTTISTGIAIELPPGYEAQIRARSGNAAKHGIGVVNGIGTIDSDYRGELGVILINHGKEDFVINHGDRIAQMIIAKYETVQFSESDVLTDTERGEGGFGSTGLKD